MSILVWGLQYCVPLFVLESVFPSLSFLDLTCSALRRIHHLGMLLPQLSLELMLLQNQSSIDQILVWRMLLLTSVMLRIVLLLFPLILSDSICILYYQAVIKIQNRKVVSKSVHFWLGTYLKTSSLNLTIGSHIS